MADGLIQMRNLGNRDRTQFPNVITGAGVDAAVLNNTENVLF